MTLKIKRSKCQAEIFNKTSGHTESTSDLTSLLDHGHR